MKKKIDHFWTWFVENEKRFWDYNEENSHDYLIEIQEQLEFARDKEGNGFALEFSEVSPSVKRLEISPDGVQELFDRTIEVVEAAPHLENWEFVAFRQPIPAPFSLQYQNMEFDTAKMFFLAYEDEDDELNLTIFGEKFDEYKKENENQFYHYGLTTIDNLIGEYNCVMRVKGYDFLDVSEVGDQEVYPLDELPEFLSDYYGDDDEVLGQN
jgi:hypothetical protein